MIKIKNNKSIFQGISIFAAFCIGLFCSINVSAASIVVTSNADMGLGSLRAAITQANGSPGLDTITFTAVSSITLATPLPAITDPVIIDGGTSRVELNGTNTSSAGTGSIGLYVRAGGSTIKSMVINRFASAGIRIDTDGVGTDNGVTVISCYIGTNVAGAAASPNINRGILIVGTTGHFIGNTDYATDGNLISGNMGRGVEITGGGSATVRGNRIGTNAAGTGNLGNSQEGILIVNSGGSTIGGTSTGHRNVISGNTGSGISIFGDFGSPASNNTVVGNYIGVNSTGNTALSNNGSGVVIQASNNTVGGTTPSLRNVISGNKSEGVSIASTLATGNIVAGNYIGVGADGTTALANNNNGVRISDGASGNTIGGTGVTEGQCNNNCNTIANNGDAGSASPRAGVYLDSSAGVSNSIRGNSIFNNGTLGAFNGLGIDLGAPNRTNNDAGDPDTGPNNLQNFPTVTLANTDGVITGNINTTSATTLAIDFYRNTAADGSNSEGRTFIGTTNVTTDGTGAASFTAGTSATLALGDYVTATATTIVSALAPQAIGDTSEFSAALMVTNGTGNAGQGFESDVTPRSTGDGAVDATDVVQIRRFSIGLDSYTTSTNEFQRADGSPFSNQGDGAVDATDVVQARRYSVGLDSRQNAGGPAEPSNFAGTARNISVAKSANAVFLPRSVRVIDTKASAGQQVTVVVAVDSIGDEAGYGFSLSYDSDVLSNPVVSIGKAGGNVIANTNNPGQIGFSVDFGGDTIHSGKGMRLLAITFDVAAKISVGETSLRLDDSLANRAVSNEAAEPVETTFADGIIKFTEPVRSPKF